MASFAAEARRVMRQLGTRALAIRGEPATREHVRHILATTIDATRDALRRKLGPMAAVRRPSAALVPPPPMVDARTAVLEQIRHPLGS